MKNRSLKTVLTADNSYTLFYEELNEHYHSLDGAQSESEYVYIKNGLERLKVSDERLNIFEIGFGSGLNAILAYQWAIKKKLRINYYALEPFPIESEIIDFLLENTDIFKKNADLFKRIHNVKDNDNFEFDEHFDFHYFEKTIEGFENESLENEIDVVFFDAFAPSRQGEIWNVANLKKAYSLLRTEGILTTYCASGQFKRNLISAGFELIKEKGFGKKREMFLGLKSN